MIIWCPEHKLTLYTTPTLFRIYDSGEVKPPTTIHYSNSKILFYIDIASFTSNCGAFALQTATYAKPVNFKLWVKLLETYLYMWYKRGLLVGSDRYGPCGVTYNVFKEADGWNFAEPVQHPNYEEGHKIILYWKNLTDKQGYEEEKAKWQVIA